MIPSVYPPVTIIVGSGRSGSTWLSETLQKCGYSTFGEQHLISAYARRSGPPGTPLEPSKAVASMFAHKEFSPRAYRHMKQDDVVSRVREPTLRGVCYAFLESFAASRGAEHIAWKNPVDSFHVPLLANLLPTARFVHLIRDGHDVAASVVPLWWGACNLYTGGRYWRNTVAAVWSARPAVDRRYHEVRFEDLLGGDEHVAELAAFIGCDTGKFVDLVRLTRKADRRNAWKTKMTKEQIRLVEAGCQETLIAANYETEFNGKAELSSLNVGRLLVQDLASRMVRRARRVAHGRR